MRDTSRWSLLQEIAGRYAGQSVLYCLTFSHGLMKVGKTQNMKSRLEALSAHGLLRSVAVNLVVQPVNTCLADAEKIALKRFAGLAQQHEPEVFSVLDLGLVKSVLAESADMAKEKQPKPEATDAFFDSCARSSGMYAAMIHLAINRAKETGMHARAAELLQVVETTPPGELNEVVRNMLGKSSTGAANCN